MHFLAAATLNVKLKQDASDFSAEDPAVIAICDGIGGMDNSDQIAKHIAENIIPQNQKEQVFPLYSSAFLKEIRSKEIFGGTTLIHLEVEDDKALINYLGNGGIIHLQGDFANKKYAENFYQYTQLLNPHMNQNGALLKHISKDSSKEELESSEIRISLNNSSGDILLLFSDGINSLEVNPIITDDEDRFWRSESESIHFILSLLDKHLKTHTDKENFQDSLPGFITSTLKSMDTKNMLEDDASLGILISDRVLDHYKKLEND